LLPTFTGNAGKTVVVNGTGTDIEYITVSGAGTVSSVDVSGGTTGLTTSGGPITTSGTITLAGTLAVANGGTGLTSIAALSIPVANSANTYTTVTPTAGQSVRINAGGTAWEAYTPSTSSGTVSSVGWTGGIVTVTNPTTTPAFTIAGTSGGIPYFNSGTTWATSSALTANALVIGGGAGAAPATTTTGTGILTFLGTPSSANLASAVTDETGSGALVFATAPSLSGVRLNDGYTEEVYAVVDAAGVAISPTNGSIQTWTLGASRTPTAGTWAAGQSMTLMINDGTAYTVTWTTLGVTWVGGSAPTLATTGFTVIQLWKVGSTIYGALTGSVA